MTVQVMPATTGGWLAFVSGPRMLALAPSTDDGFVAAAWAALATPTGFQTVLDLLAGGGLSSMPAFALVEWSGAELSGAEARVIVRGEASITVTDAATPRTLSGAGISTWLESSLPGVTAISFTVAGAVAAASGTLPLVSGVALVAALSWGAADDAAPAPTVAAPVPAVAAAPPAAVPPRAAAPKPVAAAVAVAAKIPAAAPTPPEPDPADTVREAPSEKPPKAAEKPGPEKSDPAAEGYDYLFGDTMYRSVADAAVREPDEDEAAAGATEASPIDGDHDGHTVLTSDIAKLRGSRKRTAATAAMPPAPAAPKLVLVVSTTGAREPLNTSILVGRAPSVSKVSGGQIPRLVTLGADQDISRNHAQISLEGGTVVVTDLHSKNGTSVVLPGKSAQKLRAGEPTSVIVGTVVDLGGGLTLTVDED